MTLVLLSDGAQEVNPIMATVVYRSVTFFTSLKMAMTGVGVVLMVFLARYRFMRLIRVEMALYAVLAGYLTLIGYELWLVSKIGEPTLL
jgi:sensor histidine kinase YesM